MDLGAEFRLFCLALRRPHGADDLAEMRRLAAGLGRWEMIVRGARRHRVAPAVLAGLQACASPHLPADAVAQLSRLSRLNARRSLAQVAEVARLCQIFAEAGIRVLVIKGVALSAQLYGDPARRVARDIDLLVDPPQFASAQAVMIAAGYRQGALFRSARHYAAYLHSIKEVEYFHAVSGELVELHHRLVANPNLLSVPFATLWREREELNLGGRHIATLARHRLPLYLCAHGADHCWARLNWLVDFAAAVQQAEGTDSLITAADAAGLRPAFLHAAGVAKEWLGLARYWRDAGCVDAHVKRLDWLLRRLYTAKDWYHPAPKRSLRYALWERLYRLLLKPDWRYRAAHLQADWFCPADWEAVPLPEALFWLYPFVRPWGWLLRRRAFSVHRGRRAAPRPSSSSSSSWLSWRPPQRSE